MLQSIRDRAHGIMAWVILIAIAVPFALWGIQNYLDVGKEKPVVTIGDKELFERDVNRIAEQDLSSLVGLGEQDEKAIRKQALERLIYETLLRDEVMRLRMGLGDDDLRAVIQSLPYFQTDGKFDKEKYKLSVSAKGMDSNAFAAQIRMAVAMDQYQHAIGRTGFATPHEIDQYLRLKNQKRTLEYLVVPVGKKAAEPTPPAVDAYYHAHEAQFQTPEQVAVQYVEISLDQVAQQVAASEEELKAYYEEQKAAYVTPERRKASHILIAVEHGAKDDVYAAALTKAKQAQARLTKEDFAVVAKAVSEDTLSANKGGDLGFVSHGQMDKNFEDALFQLKPGQVSEPVKTAFGYHLIKLTELVPGTTKRYEEVKDELRKNFQRNAAEKKFYELGEKLSQVSFEHSDSLDFAADAMGVKLQETGLFTREAGAGIADNAAVRSAAFSQDVLDGRNSEAVEISPEHVVVLRMKEHKAAALRPLDEVRAQIQDRLRHEAAEAAAKDQAQALYAKFEQGTALAELAQAEHLTVQKTKAFGRDDNEVPPEILMAAFRMARPAAGQSRREAELPRLLETGKRLTAMSNGDQLILHLLSVEDADPAGVDAKEKSSLRDLLGRSKGQAELTALMQQLRADEEVRIEETKE
ncbi:MAG: peptidylprolyl isomerase [Methylococcaceae bacterium]|nr:MAG: peptidylprolyl isomerase [Methylococcaceae bacterium]